MPESPTTYLIRVRGVLDPGWSAWFAGMEVRSDRPGESVVVGPVVDQAALPVCWPGSATWGCR